MRFAKRLFPILIILLTVLTFACPALAEDEGLLVLPKNIQVVKSEAFKGATGFERVIITEGAHTIESNAFAGSSLQQIQLPVSMTKIAEDAFGELKPLIIAVENTHAYGRANGLGLPLPERGQAVGIVYRVSVSDQKEKHYSSSFRLY